MTECPGMAPGPSLNPVHHSHAVLGRTRSSTSQSSTAGSASTGSTGLLYVSNERAGILRDPVRGAPDLVIEIVSPSSRRTDEVAKRKLYERVGVREYWVVDPELEAVKV